MLSGGNPSSGKGQKLALESRGLGLGLNLEWYWAGPFLNQEEQSWFRLELSTHSCIPHLVMIRTWVLCQSFIASYCLVQFQRPVLFHLKTEAQNKAGVPVIHVSLVFWDTAIYVFCLHLPNLLFPLTWHPPTFRWGSCVLLSGVCRVVTGSLMHGFPMITIRAVGLKGRTMVLV